MNLTSLKCKLVDCPFNIKHFREFILNMKGTPPQRLAKEGIWNLPSLTCNLLELSLNAKGFRAPPYDHIEYCNLLRLEIVMQGWNLMLSLGLAHTLAQVTILNYYNNWLSHFPRRVRPSSIRLSRGATRGGRWGRAPPPAFRTLAKDRSPKRGETHFTLYLRLCFITSLVL